MDTGKLRYLALSLGSTLVGLGVYLDKIPPEGLQAAIVIILGIAGADMIKHRSD